MIYCGGTCHENDTLPQSLVIMRDKNISILQLEGGIIDFVILSASPWISGRPSYTFKVS